MIDILTKLVKRLSMKTILKLMNGNVYQYNLSGQKINTYYTKGDCILCQWFNEKEESVLLQLKNGKNLIINKSCQVIKII